MTTKFGFTKMTIQEFEDWINVIKLARTVLTVQQHHTLIPSYVQFKGTNHFEIQQNMKHHHVNANGWSDIGQHFSTFPDGTILTGRSMEKTPACITGQNSNDICLEHVGNFDLGKDTMTSAHRDTILRMTAKLCSRFKLPVNTHSIVYHHWFNLSDGNRNNGTKNNKSCPGANFFGGNKVAHCETNFLPLISTLLKGQPPQQVTTVQQYAMVTARTLNIRTQPDSAATKVTGREPATLGAVLRVHKEQNGWYKIANSEEHWVMAKHTIPVLRAKVNADKLNARSGPDKTFDKNGLYTKGQELFVGKLENGWYNVGMDNKWVSEEYLNIQSSVS